MDCSGAIAEFGSLVVVVVVVLATRASCAHTCELSERRIALVVIARRNHFAWRMAEFTGPDNSTCDVKMQTFLGRGSEKIAVPPHQCEGGCSGELTTPLPARSEIFAGFRVADEKANPVVSEGETVRKA